MPNSKKNQKCWNCSHFQRYATGDEPNAVYGECRRDAIKAYLYWDDWFDSYQPFIPVASVYWCSGWKQTTLSVPPIPETPVISVWPDVFWDWVTWNVKTSINISCLKCNHFQRYDPDDPEDLWGECRKYPPEPVTTDHFGQTTDIMPGEKIEFIGTTYWCGCFEKQQDPTQES